MSDTKSAFDKLKQKRKDSIKSLQKAAEEQNNTSYEDAREWKPTVDTAGNGYAVIRFLPTPPDSGLELPWVRYWDHFFKGPTGRWFVEKSLTTLGKDDPVSESNSELWNSGSEKNKDIARARKRKLHYVSNILVIHDPACPENEGKVFYFQYGKKIFDKIMDIMKPEFEDETPVNPFDFWEGANFKIKIRQVEGYRNYDKSEFDKPSELFEGDEEKLKEIYESLHPIQEFVDPSTFKSYTELASKLNLVLGEKEVKNSMSAKELNNMENTASSKDEDSNVTDDSKEDDGFDYFKKLAEEDDDDVPF